MKTGGILETCLHVGDLEAAIAFYQRLFGFEIMARDDRFCAFNVAPRDVLLLFKRGASTKPMPVPGGIIPPHDGQGRMHIAFAIAAQDLAGWESRLISRRLLWNRPFTGPREARASTSVIPTSTSSSSRLPASGRITKSCDN